MKQLILFGLTAIAAILGTTYTSEVNASPASCSSYTHASGRIGVAVTLQNECSKTVQFKICVRHKGGTDRRTVSIYAGTRGSVDFRFDNSGSNAGGQIQVRACYLGAKCQPPPC